MKKNRPLDPYLAWCLDRACLIAGRAEERRIKREYEEQHEGRPKYMGSGRAVVPQHERKVVMPRPESGVEYNERKQTISGELPFIGRQR